MAKDPAMLWYWNDWQGGTVTLSRHLKGCYIDLLHAQFNNGHLSIDEIKTVLGLDFSAWDTLQKKFECDPKGLFFNKRLEQEQAKRKAFTESRRLNRLKRHDTTYVEHTKGHMENENEDENIDVIVDGGTGREEIPLPFPGDDFKTWWAKWKEYRVKQHGKRYPLYGEETDLRRLKDYGEDRAIAAIQQAITSNWANLYPEKSQTTTKRFKFT